MGASSQGSSSQRAWTRLPALLLAAAALATLLPQGALAQSPIQISLLPPVQIVPEDESVSGIRLGVYARNRNMTGLDWGVVTHTTGDATALQIAAVNWVEGDFSGLQLGWGLGGSLANIVGGHMQGLQVGIYNGVATGQGFQWGLVNQASERMQGFQLSLVNIAEDFEGLQIGLINIIRSKERFPVLPLVNWKSN